MKTITNSILTTIKIISVTLYELIIHSRITMCFILWVLFLKSTYKESSEDVRIVLICFFAFGIYWLIVNKHKK